MDAFEYRQQALYCEDVALERIAERFGTPAYVYSGSAILANFRRLARPLERS